MALITSTDNQKIKNLLKLEKSKERKLQGVAVVEGEKDIKAALKAGLRVQEIFYCPEFGNPSPVDFGIEQKHIAAMSKEVFLEITRRENPDGYIAIILVRNYSLENIKLESNPLIVVVEGAEKPGNLGAILRTADAAGVDVIIFNDPQIDIYNPNAIRSSIGTIFNQQIVLADREQTISWLNKNKIKSFATSKKAEKIYFEHDFVGGTAFVLGAEHSGLSEEWKEEADEFIKIPMTGIVDSLNLSVSAGILLFEAVRQRKLV